MKKKICLVCDVRGWAFDFIAQVLLEKLSNQFNVKIIYSESDKYSNNLFKILEENKGYDIIHFFWRKILLQFDSNEFIEQIKEKGYNYNEYVNNITNKISTCVYDHLYLEKESIEIYKNVFNKYCKKYYISTKRLEEIYLNIIEYKKPNLVIYDIYDSKKFFPNNLNRFNDINRKLQIGWVGNSKRTSNTIDLKGFSTIIEPVVNELIDEGYNIYGNYADRNIIWRSNDEMPEYYNNIDICICTSIHEGTPRPMLEAVACGVPVITTDVGIVRELLGQKQKEYIIGDRKNGLNDGKIRKKLKEILIYLYNNKDVLKQLSQENIESIKKYDINGIINTFNSYFNMF